jgi:predicted transcriptional regulator of viral defense system
MKHYEKLLEKGCFNRKQLIEAVGTPAAAKNVIYEYQKKGYIERVKRDFYVVISMETKQPVLSRYQIGSNLFPDASISHHSALEFFGYASQVFYECYVTTESRFADFEYDGIIYHRVEKKPDIDVIQQGKVRTTSIEQTIVDSIRDFEKIAGLEEVIRCLMLVPGLKEDKVLECLKRNENGFLYQKCGYIFEELNDEFGFSNAFFEECMKKSSGAKRYLMKEAQNTVLSERWKLYTPPSLKRITDKGVSDYDAIG